MQYLLLLLSFFSKTHLSLFRLQTRHFPSIFLFFQPNFQVFLYFGIFLKKFLPLVLLSNSPTFLFLFTAWNFYIPRFRCYPSEHFGFWLLILQRTHMKIRLVPALYDIFHFFSSLIPFLSFLIPATRFLLSIYLGNILVLLVWIVIGRKFS